MKSNVDENIKDTMLNLLKELEDDLCSLLNSIEQDYTIQDESWNSIDSRSSGLFYLITQLREEIIS